MTREVAIVGIGQSEFGRFLPTVSSASAQRRCEPRSPTRG